MNMQYKNSSGDLNNENNVYRNYPMFSDAKIYYFGEKQGVSENKGCQKTMFLALKNNYFGEKQGVSENKGCPWGNYGKCFSAQHGFQWIHTLLFEL